MLNKSCALFPPGLDSYRINTRPLPSTSLQRTSPSISMLQVSSVALRSGGGRPCIKWLLGRWPMHPKGRLQSLSLAVPGPRRQQGSRKSLPPGSSPLWVPTYVCPVRAAAGHKRKRACHGFLLLPCSRCPDGPTPASGWLMAAASPKPSQLVG